MTDDHRPPSAPTRARRRTWIRSAALAGIATVTVAGSVACSAGGDPIAVGPSITSPARATADRASGDESRAVDSGAVEVLARAAAQPIDSGRLTLTVGGSEIAVRFEGDDVVAALGSRGPEVVVVDGTAYLRNGERWVTIPGLGDLPIGTATFDASGMVERIRGVLDDSAVTAPGEAVTVDGEALTRYRAKLDGKEAVDLFSEAGTAAKLLDGDERGRRILGYGMDHTTVEVIGHVDADGVLRRLEITSTLDGSAYPDCALLTTTGEMRIVLSDIDRPQGIAAPPADSVDSLLDLDPSELLGGLADQLGGSNGETIDPGALPGALGDLAERMPSGELPIGDPGAVLDELYAGCPE